MSIYAAISTCLGRATSDRSRMGGRKGMGRARMAWPLLAHATLGSLGIVALPSAAYATEGNQIEYPIGVNTVVAAIRPEPGQTRYYNYLLDYSADETTNAFGRSAVPNFNLKTVVNAARLMHTWGFSEHGFTLTSTIVVPVVHSQLTAGPRKGSLTGFGDVNIQNYVNWHDPHRKLFLSTGLTVWLPTGRYDPARLVNTGLNHYTIAPELDVTWLFAAGWEASATTVFEKNWTNHETHYHSGSDSITDFSVMGALPGLKWAHLGVDGYYYRQLDNDRRNGIELLDTDRARVASIGPQARFDIGRAGVAFKLQHEFAARLRPEGNRLWFQFTLPLSRASHSAPVQAPPPEK